jgi:UDP-3-O-[3-hydroxymyristoyl] glucosamine N-acyltransferase
VKLTIAQIAEKIGGTLEGDGLAVIDGVAGIADAGPNEITFLSNPRYFAAAATTRAGAIVAGPGWNGPQRCPIIRVKDVEKASTAVIILFTPPEIKIEPGIHATAVIADTVKLGREVTVGPCCVLEAGVVVGDRTRILAGCYLGHDSMVGCDGLLYPNVSIRERTRIGDRVIIHCGAVLGSDGYGFAPEQKDGKLVIRKIPQTGIVDVGNDVEIGANVTIDRARFGKTRIGNSVKIDNLVHIAHNVTVGECTGIIAQSGISGSVSIGSRVILYGQAGVAGHLTIGDGAVVGAQAGVTKDVPPGTFVSGYPAMPHDKAAKAHAGLMRIPQLKERVAEIEKRLSALESQ